MKESPKIILNPDQIKIERMNNLVNVKNTLIKHSNSHYKPINPNVDLSDNAKFWVTDNGVFLKITPGEGINFYHKFSSGEKGIILDYPLKGDFKLKFKLNYQVIVNFLLGTDHLINFRNAPLKNDCELKTNVWHDMEFSRKDGIVSITADGNLIRTVESDESLFIIRVYNDSREVNISEFHATVEPAKNEGELASRVEYLENNYKDEVSSLKKELEQYKNITDKVLDSYNYLFNNLYIDYELKPKQLLNDLHSLLLELMEFVGKVCEKHGLNYWIDFGNLLGAVRHGGFIPWDDDADIGMIRKDFIKFEKILQKEIDEHNLSEYVRIAYHPRKIDGQPVDTFMAIRIYSKMKSYKGKRIISNIDVVPYDFMTEYEERGFRKRVAMSRENLYRNKLNQVSEEEWLKQYYDELNLTFDEKSKYIIPGVDALEINRSVVETKTLFPLKEIKFEDKMFPCPNNPDRYMKGSYGDYMMIPKNLHRHGRMSMLRYNQNNDEVFEKMISIFREVNENF
jgi:phosphorylcholine metabolism protein LicD